MTHLDERLTDFVFGELSPNDMEEARRHLAGCADCRDQVEQFEHTRSLLRMSPDVEPPRRIFFEFEKRRPVWNWLVPAGLAAAALVLLLVALPIQFQWHSSQLTIVLGRTQTPVAVVAPLNVSQPSVQPIDYERIAKDVESADRAWLVDELKKHDSQQMKQIRLSLEGDWDYLNVQQQKIEKDNVANAVNIQRIAQRSEEQ